MTDPSTEHVLVVPTAVFHAAGLFQGFSADVEHYLPRLLDVAHLRFLPRAEAEHDPGFKQLIPYVVLRCGGSVFHYTRGAAGSEKRLTARRSLGLGGHVCAEDAATSPDPYRAGLLREMAEEVELGSSFREQAVGLINDDSSAVGAVHLGIVHIYDLKAPEARLRDPALTAGGFAPLSDLRAQRGDFETWSQFLLDEGRLG